MNYICEYCNKVYSSRQSRWNHIKNCHEAKSQPKTTYSSKSKSKSNWLSTYDDMASKIFNCSYYHKDYKHKQSKYKHEKICKNKETFNVEIFEKK